MFLTAFFEQLINVDKDVLLAINGYHSVFADGVMYLYSNKWVWIPFYAALLYVIIRNYSWRTTLLLMVAVALIIVISDQVTAKVIRAMVDRYRPSHDETIAPLVHTVMGWKGGLWSFPSAHAANAWALVTFMTLLFRRRWFAWMMVGWGAVMCYSRMYLGLHFPGDLIVGAIVGALAAVIVWLVLHRLLKVEQVRQPRQLYVPAAILALTLITFVGIAAFHLIPV